MSIEIATTIETAVETKTKKITLSGKYSKFLVFGNWLIQQINADEELTSKAQEQLQLFASPQQQNLFFETFFDDIKSHTNSMKTIIKLHNKPTPKIKTVNKPKPTNDNPKPKPKPKPNTKSLLVNDPQQALVDAIVNAAQTEIQGVPLQGAPTVPPYPLPFEEEAYIKEVEVEVVETKEVEVEVVETKEVEVEVEETKETKEEKKAELLAKKEAKETELLAKKEAKETELLAKKEAKETELLAKKEAKETELLAKKEAKEIELLAKKEAKEIELLAKKEAKETELLAKKEAKETELLAKKEAKEAELLAKKEAKEAELLTKKNTKNTVKKLTKQKKNEVVIENENKNEANTIVTTIINTVVEKSLDTAIDNLCGNFGDIALEDDDDDQETLNLRPIHFPDGSDFLLDELTNHLYDPNSIHDIDFTHVALYHNNTFNYI